MRRSIPLLLSLVLSALLAACASAPEVQRVTVPLIDQRFAAPSAPVAAAEVFALNDAMRHYVHVEIAAQVRAKGRMVALADALLRHGGLKLEYDAGMTRNAAQTFEARSGNCLSLVIMTAALAREMGLQVEYKDVYAEETWGRSDDVYYAVGHVDIALVRPKVDPAWGRNEGDRVIIDFLPPRDAARLHSRVIGERTIVAMYMNNRAVESLVEGKLDDAYWWARGAIGQDPQLLRAYNTLGAIYLRHGDVEPAGQVFAEVLARDPRNTRALSNQIAVLRLQGRDAEAGALAATLAEVEPEPPFFFFKRGLAALRAGDLAGARDLFEREVRRAGDYHEFHFWLAVANAGLGDVEAARRHLTFAMENSTTRRDHDLYAAKLDRIRATRLQ